MITILSSASARPNFVKLAAVHHALAHHPNVRHVIVHTGQHYDPLLSDIFFTQLGIPEPDENLGVKGGAHREEIIEKTAQAMTPVLERVRPDIVLVYGDVNGAVGAARAAAGRGVRIGHVEAGLRSFDLTMPEEQNRIEIDRLSQDLFVSEPSGMAHLSAERVEGAAHFVGNTMIDTLVRMLPAVRATVLPFPLPKRFGIATIHRPSNVDVEPSLTSVLQFLAQVAERCPLLLPLHHRARQSIDRWSLWPLIPPSITVVSPLGYLEFLHALDRADFVITDSGGIQEEATFLKKRCFTLRRNTERPSTMESGSNVLIDERNPEDRRRVMDALEHSTGSTVNIPPLWDGRAGERIATDIVRRFASVTP